MKTESLAKKQNDRKKVISKQIFASIKKETLAWLLLLPTLLALIITIWNPVIKGIILSFYETKGYTSVGFTWLANYRNVFTDSMFIQTVINTFKYVFWSLTIGFLPSLILALLLNEVIHFSTTFKVVTYLPVVAPGLAVSMIWASMYSPASGGLLNMVLLHFGLPAQQWLLNSSMTIPLIVISMTWNGCAGAALLYLATLKSVSQDLYEAAVIDGAGIWKRLFHITLPQIAPMMLLMFVRQIISIFQIMEQPLVMTDGGPNNASLSLNLVSYKMAFSYMQVGRSLALGSVSFIILVCVTIFYFKLQKKLSN